MYTLKRFIRTRIRNFILWALTMDIEYIEGADFVHLPMRMTEGSAGLDISATRDFEILPHERIRIPFGFIMAFDRFYEFNVRTRSGLNWKFNIDHVCSTIDGDFRKEAHVILTNDSDNIFYAKRKDRVAQIVPHIIPDTNWIKKKKLNTTARGLGGFGHTG